MNLYAAGGQQGHPAANRELTRQGRAVAVRFLRSLISELCGTAIAFDGRPLVEIVTFL